MKKVAILALAAAGLSVASTSEAVLFTWSGTSNISGNQLSASADFTAVGNVLTIVLTNTAPVPSSTPADTLGTLVWNMPGVVVVPSLTNNVTITAGSSAQQANAPYLGSFDLNQEYLYNDALTISSVNFDHGVSSVGIGAFATNNDTFYERLRGQGDAGSQPGDAFSIASASGTTNAANNVPVINNSLTFTLLMDGPIDLNQISNVQFSYGSGAQTTSIVPEPASMAALGLGVAAMIRRRKNTR